MMGARLFCKTGELAGSAFAIESDATIGSGTGNAVVLPPQTISRSHARIRLDDRGQYVLEDLDSANGTRLDSRPVKGLEVLGDLHVITFSEHHDFIFQIQAGDASVQRAEPVHQPAGTRAAMPQHAVVPPPGLPSVSDAGDPVTMYQPPAHLVAPDLGEAGAPETARASPRVTFAQPGMSVPPPLPVIPAVPPTVVQAPEAHWHLEVEAHSTGEGWSRRLVEGRQVVGRSADCELRIDHPTLSRSHVALTLRAGVLTISDLGSANGTFADDVQLKAVQQLEAREGMRLRFGEISARIVRKS